MKKGTLNPENFISLVQVPLVEHIIEFCALKLHFDFCPINARKPLKYQGFSGFVLFSRTVMGSLNLMAQIKNALKPLFSIIGINYTVYSNLK